MRSAKPIRYFAWVRVAIAYCFVNSTVIAGDVGSQDAGKGKQDPVVGMIRALEQSYRATRGFDLESEKFYLAQNVDYDRATEAEVLSLKGMSIRHNLTRYAPGLGVLIDNTHPLQRPSAQTPTGWLYTPEGMFKVGFSTNEEKETTCQRLGPTVVMALAAPLAPPCFSDLARWYMESSASPPTLDNNPNGERLLRTDMGEIHINAAGSIVGWSKRHGDGTLSRSRVVALMKTPFMDAGFPRMVLGETTGEKGKVVQSVTCFEPPRESDAPDPTEFSWTHYATVAVDMQTGERIVAPGKTDPATRIEQAPAASGRKAITFQSDSEGKMLPETGFTPSRWLLAGGVSCLVLAVAFFVRRRIKG